MYISAGYFALNDVQTVTSEVSGYPVRGIKLMDILQPNLIEFSSRQRYN